MSLRSQIIGVMTLVVILTATAFSLLIFERFNEQILKAKINDLDHETNLVAQGFSHRIDELTRDTLLVSKLPPVEVLKRSRRAGIRGVHTETDWDWSRRDLTKILKQTLIHNPSYLQIRLIGIEEGGRELIRVYRTSRGAPVQVTPRADLQPKGERDYFLATLNRPDESIYLSKVELNREHGQIQEPRTPVLRSSTPIRVGEDPIGIVVINFGAEQEFERLIEWASRTNEVFLTDELGHYIHHPNPERAFEFELGVDSVVAQDFPDVAEVLVDSAQPFRASAVDSRVESARRVDYGPPDLGRALVIFTSGSLADATKISSDVARQMVVISGVLVVAASLFGSWLAHILTQPILRLSRAVEDAESFNQIFEPPAGLSGEAAQLGNALATAISGLQQRNEDLETSNHELEQFAYIASHDLQEPIRTIHSFASLIDQEHGEALDSTGRDSLRYILESSARMQRLILGLLEYSRIGRESVAEEIDIGRLIEDILADLGAAIETSSAHIEVGPMPTLVGYAVELRILFQNLVSNGIKFSRAEEAPEITISAEPDGLSWIFRIADNGIGIEPKYRERIFFIFQRLHVREEYPGVGIGLAHARKIVDLHRGRIWVEESESGGACFCVKIQAAEG